jgi:hypothetical protein
MSKPASLASSLSSSSLMSTLSSGCVVSGWIMRCLALGASGMVDVCIDTGGCDVVMAGALAEGGTSFG